MLFAQSPAWAHHKDDHEGGRAEESQEDSETTEEESSTSEAEAEEDGDDAADDDAARDSDDGWSSYRTRDADAREEQGSSTTTTKSSTNPGGQVCDGSPRQESGGGANQSGHPYMSNCQGLPSGNGQGKARPCAGCVGAADDKFPPGQAPDGSDDNNGYECDGNQGIGKTNPAHTGCDLQPPSVCDANPSTEMIEPCISGNPPKPPKPPVPPGPPPRRPDVVLPRPPIVRFNPPDVVLNRPPGILPVTGASPLGFLLLGLGMIGTGAATLGNKRVRKGSRRNI